MAYSNQDTTRLPSRFTSELQTHILRGSEGDCLAVTPEFPDLPDWIFDADEVSSGCYIVRGRDPMGRNVEMRGHDVERLYQECKAAALRMVRDVLDRVGGSQPCLWEPINGFGSPGEFERFVDWMIEQIEAGRAKEVYVQAPHLGGCYKEKWFSHVNSASIWRLVWPDSPFRGCFSPVERL